MTSTHRAISAILWLVLTLFVPGALAAQPVTNTAPRISISILSGDTVALKQFSVGVCDDHNIVSSGRKLYWNTVDVSVSTTWYSDSPYYNCPVAGRYTGSQSAVLGLNAIKARICDELNYSWYPYGPLCTELTQQVRYRNVDVANLATTKKAPGRTGQFIDFVVRRLNNDGATTFNLSVTCTGNITSCSVPSSVTTVTSTPARVTFTTGSLGTTGTITLRATTSGVAESYDEGMVTITNEYPNGLVVSTAANNNDNQALDACASGCFAATAAVSTVPYFSMDAPRNVTIAYQGDRVALRPFLYADVALDSLADAVQELKLQFRRPNGQSITFLNGDSVLRFSPGSIASRTVRLAGQLDAVANGMGSTGMYAGSIVVTGVYGDHVETQTIPARLMVVNDRGSSIARGWTAIGVQRLHAQSGDVEGALITTGGGSAIYFVKSGSSYVAPAGDFTSLRYDGGADTSRRWIRATPDSTKFYFNQAGLLTAVVTRTADEVRFGYDAQQRLVSIRDPYYRTGVGHRFITLRYGTSGSPTAYGLREIEEPAYNTTVNGGRVTRFTVNGGDSTLRTVQDPDSGQTVFHYDGLGRLDTLTDRGGRASVFVYRTDGSWKLAAMRSPTVAVDNGGGTTTNVQLETLLQPWHTVGVPTSTTASTSAVPVALDSVEATATDPGGHTMRVTVDRWGQPLRVTDALGNVTQHARNAHGQLTGVTYPTGTSDSYTYSGPFVTSSRSAGQSADTYFTYGAFGQLTYTSGNGPAISYHLDSLGRVDSTRTGGAYRVRYVYDSQSRVTQVIDPEGHTTQYFYDPVWGNRDSVRTHDGKGSRTHFDRYGRDSVSRSAGRAGTTAIYDVMNRVTAGYDGVNANPTTTTYVLDEPVRVVDPRGQVYKMVFNAVGWPTRVHDARDTTRYVAYTYTRDGLVASQTNLEGRRVEATYDSLHRVATVADPVGGSIALGYNALGTRVAAASYNPASALISLDSTFTSNAGWTDSIVTRLNGNRFARRYHRNPYWGHLDSLVVGDSIGIDFRRRVWYRNTVTGVLDSLRLDTLRVRFGYNADRLRTTTTWATGLTRTEAWSAEHRPAAVYFSVGGLNAVFSRSFATDSQGRLHYQARNNAGAGVNGANRATIQRFSFDPLGRLGRIQHETVDSGEHCHYEGMFQICEPFEIGDTTRKLGVGYDAVGNLTQLTDSLTAIAVLGKYGQGNRLDTLGQATYAYDLDGNLVSRTTPAGTTTFGWDGRGQLRWAASGADTTYFDYDAGGQLVRRRKPAGVTDRWFLWDQGQLLAELNGAASARLAEYAYLPGADQPLAMITGGTGASVVHWYQQDVRGNIEGVFSTSGTLEQTLSYDAWGVPEDSTSSIGGLSRLRWKGLYYEGGPAALYYMRARWYDPAARRFVSQDPIGLAGGINQYAFAEGDPVGGSDPTGLCPPCPQQLPVVNVTVRPWQPPAPWTGGYANDGSPDYNSFVSWTSEELNLARRREEAAGAGQSLFALFWSDNAALTRLCRPNAVMKFAEYAEQWNGRLIGGRYIPGVASWNLKFDSWGEEPPMFSVARVSGTRRFEARAASRGSVPLYDYARVQGEVRCNGRPTGLFGHVGEFNAAALIAVPPTPP